MAGQEFTAKKAKVFALFGVGVAAFIGAYQIDSPLVSLVFVIAGLICVGVAGKMARGLNT